MIMMVALLGLFLGREPSIIARKCDIFPWPFLRQTFTAPSSCKTSFCDGERQMRRDFRGFVLAAGTAALATALPLGAASEKIDYEAINENQSSRV